MEVLIKKQNVILDSQILTTLMSCGRLADFRFNLDLIPTTGKSNSLEMGGLVHKVFEVYGKNIIDGRSRAHAIEQGLAAGQLFITGCGLCKDFVSNEREIKPACGHKPNEYPGVSAPQESEGYKIGWKWALETCEQYFEFWKNDSWILLEVEVTKGKVLYEDDDLRIMWKAKFDKIVDTNQGVLPSDYKTMKQRRDTLSLNNQFMGQVILCGVRNIVIDKVGFQTTLKPNEKFGRVVVPYDIDRLLEWQSEILPYWARMMLMYNESGYWPPNFTHCENKYGKCSFIDVCSANRNMREELLRQEFKIGLKWDITNDDED